jgi:hypothetical protein
MKRSAFLLLPAAMVALLLSSYSGKDSKYPGGAPAGYTGSPSDNQNCTACHNGSASTVQNWITSDVGPEGYVPGQTYTITVTVTGSGTKGFEVSPQNQAGDLLGTLVAGTGSKLVGSGKYVTHTSSSNANPKVWTFQWTAPDAGTGPVTMYGAFALNKSATKLSTLAIAENTTTSVPEAVVPGGIKVFPNPAIDLMHVGFNLESASDVTISLVNISTGIKQLLKREKMSPGAHDLSLDCSTVANGSYILLMDSGTGKSQTKVIIRH